MRLFIAEKPSLARAIAEGLGGGKPSDGHIVCGGDVITWCFGHMYEQAEPDAYDQAWKKWTFGSLPISVETWKILPRKDAKKQIKVIKGLLAKASSVVNAGDPDREGQLLVDEVLEELKNSLPVQRIWLASLDLKSVKKALADLRDNQKYQAFKDAALGRSRADWLVGMNLTRATTIIARQQGVDGVLSVGRVQTPTLGLVVARDREIENFVSKDYFVPQIVVHHKKGEFDATWLPANDDSPGMDPDGRLVDRAVAEALIAKVKGQSGKVLQASYSEKKQGPPLPHSLSSLQKAASGKFGFKAAQTLKVAQGLYEEKLTTYPRTDCRYLPEEQFDDAASILKSLAAAGLDIARNADPKLRANAWNTKKITAHHAIIPTGQKPTGLSGDEQKLYGMICESYVCLFYPDYRYIEQSVICEIAGEQWKGNGRQDIDRGWRALSGEKKAEKLIPAGIGQGDDVSCMEAKLEACQTKPPSFFTDGTLIEAMASVHKFVSDPKVKKLLKENAGIGTEATRAGIIETLLARKYLAQKGKQLRSSELGRQLVDNLPRPLVDPATTAIWESALEQVADGKLSLEAFLHKQAAVIPTMIDAVAEKADFSSVAGPTFPCPECGHALKRLKSKKKGGGYFWVCFNEEGHKEKSPLFMCDEKRKPGSPFGTQENAPKAPCPEEGCGEMMIKRESRKKKGSFFWACPNKKHPLRADDDGKPGQAFGERK